MAGAAVRPAALVAGVVLACQALAAPAAGYSHARQVSATWYCLPGRSACTRGYPAGGAYAAAGWRLAVGAWRGRVVRTCRVDRPTQCVLVRLIDRCACSGIDLYASAFRRLAPLGTGRVAVVVRW